MKTSFTVSPVAPCSILRQEDFFVWGGSMISCPDGRYRIYYSRWPKAAKYAFESWVIDSEIACAVSDDPLGPYEFEYVVLPRRNGGFWDGACTHNPNIIEHDGKYYLYYMGNTLNENPSSPEFSKWWNKCHDFAVNACDEVLKSGPDTSVQTWHDSFGDSDINPAEAAFAFWWNHRTHQRIGVAVADNPTGPWQRFDRPVLDVTPGTWDELMVSNPSCCQMPDGRFIMMYKGCGTESKMPRGGPVLHSIAFADAPIGPFVKHPEPLFVTGETGFSLEDPFIWSQDGKLFALLKDMAAYHAEPARSLMLYTSDNGIDWTACDPPVGLTRELIFEDGKEFMPYRLERPQLYLENGRPAVLFAAIQPVPRATETYNLHVKVEFN
jgi:hypothetical protein